MVQETTDRSMAQEMEELASLVANLREDEVMSAITRHLDAGVSPTGILAACQKGMRLVGSMHETGHYYIAGLIMAGEIMHQAMDLLKAVMIKARRGKTNGRVVLGTIAGDIHDIGKNLFRDLLECHGVTVLDLGVDVPPADFVRAESEFKPHLIAVSVLITESFPHLPELVQLSRESAQPGSERPFILIGGGQVDERVFRMSGADDWAQDAFAGIQICQRFMKGRKRLAV